MNTPATATTTSALHHIPNRTKPLPPLRVGIGGPVGSGKTTILEMLCKAMATSVVASPPASASWPGWPPPFPLP